MKRLWTALLLALALALALTPAALARGLAEDKVIVGDNYTLSEGETIDGNLIVLGGNVEVEAGAEITGNLVIFGGNVTLSGRVSEDVVVFGGNADLRSTAVVEGELITSGGSISREAGSEVRGSETQSFGPDFPLRPIVVTPEMPGPLDFLLNLVFRAVQALVLAVVVAVLALLVALLLPEQTARVSAAMATAPILSGFLGLLTLIAVPVLAALVALITLLCLSPVSLIALIVYVAALVFGWLALGALVGERLAGALKLRGLSPIVATALGAFLVTGLVHGLGALPFGGDALSGLLQVVLGALGLGAVTLTRFGTQPYVPGGVAPAAPMAPPPPAPPPPPVMPETPAEPSI